MHRIDGPGATVGNLWTEGNPGGGIPATTVTDDFMNDIQEEIVTVIEDAGIALVKGQQDQLKLAIQDMISSGGGSGGSNLSQSITNNQAAPLSLTGLLFDKLESKAGSFMVDIHRQTDTQDKQETGTYHVAHDPKDDVWRINGFTSFDASGVTLSITAGGQVQYTSDDLTGASYSGTIRVIDVKKVPQTIS